MEKKIVTKLAKIESAKVGIDRGCFLTWWLHVKYEDGFCQGIGGYTLDDYDEKLERRVGTAYGADIIRQIMVMFDVDDFSKLKGRYMWVTGESCGFAFDVKGIKPLKLDNPDADYLDFEDFLKFWKDRMGV